MSSVLLTPLTQENAATLRNQLAAEKLAQDKANLAAMAKELQLQEDRATQDRLLAKLAKDKGLTPTSAKTINVTAEDNTRRTLLNIVSAVILSVVTLMFLHYYASNPTFVMICCFLYIVLYCAFVIYVVNKVEDSFPDKTLSIVAKWSSILSLVLCVLLAISTTKNALFAPKKPESNKLLDSSGNQLYPPGGQNNQMRKKNKGFNNQGQNNQRFNNNNQGYNNQGQNNQGQNQGYNNNGN
jgi:hypothetical protein